MEELFRFAVVRATTRSVPGTSSLAEPPRPVVPPTTNAPLQTFQQRLAAVAAQVAIKNGTAEQTWSQLEPVAADYLASSSAALLGGTAWTELATFVDELRLLVDAATGAPLTIAAIAAVVARHAALAQTANGERSRLDDFFLALLVIQRGGPNTVAALSRQQPTPVALMLLVTGPSLRDVALRIGAATLLATGATALAADPQSDEAGRRAAFTGALDAALAPTLLLPPILTAFLPKPSLGVGFRELHVVRQHIRRYEAGEVARIENVLKGETRDHSINHTLSTETDTTVASSTSSSTDASLQSDERDSIRNATNTVVSADTKLDAGVQARFSAPSYKLDTNLAVSNTDASRTSRDFAADTARDVVQRAASQVRDASSSSQTTRVLEELEDHERQAFDNRAGTANISGVYQWVEKVYLAQVFNLGRHLLIDLAVPEPGANLLAQATITSAESTPPVAPHPLGTTRTNADGTPFLDTNGQLQLDAPLGPLDISENARIGALPDPNFYGTWIARYGATDVDPPPAGQRTFSQPKIFPYQDDNDPSDSGSIQVDDGYAAVTVFVTATAMRNDNPSGSGATLQDNVYVHVSIGAAVVALPWPDAQRTHQLSGNLALTFPATGNVAYSIYGRNIDQMTINVELIAVPVQDTIDRWKLETYEKIATAYRDRQQAYATALAAMRMATQTVGPLGAADPDTNRATERTELKRSAIAVLDDNNATVAGSIAAMAGDAGPSTPNDPTQPQLPEPVLSIAQSLGFRIRWFEQAFAWEDMAYVTYPYFWGRRQRWIPGLLLQNADPLFLAFLQSGYARVVVPVRPGFEKAVQFYLATGLPWLGGDLATVASEGNPLYLDVAEEVKALTDDGADGAVDEPVGAPWEYALPTTLVRLRADAALPEWHRVGPDGQEDSAFASDAPFGAWSWVDGAP